MPELLERRKVRQRFKHAVLAASLKKKIADLKKDAGSDEDNDMRDAEQAVVPGTSADSLPQGSSGSRLRDTVKSGAFVQVVLAKVKDERQKQEALEVDQELEQEARRRSRSFNGTGS